AAVGFVVRVAVTRRWGEAWLIVILTFPLPLWIVSQVEPLFLFRYGLFATPFFALAVVLLLSRVVLVVPVLALVLALSVPLQIQYREADGHSDDFRGVLAGVSAAARPGDAVITDSWLTRAATRYYLRDTLADPLNPGTRTSALIRSSGGLPCRADLFAQYNRVWFIQSERTNDQVATSRPDVCLPGFETAQDRTDRGVRAELWVRTTPAA
ncbi:hypothetical protein, partial [Jatrophihabitans endophyticus]|uniref:hypothetical protein n=1 Tax=Jatrophihabitans endophyticus TaxID=1206085 RepID=UPI001A0C5CF6